MVSYEDVGAAVDWLSNAFGFRESGERFSDGDGRVTHAELSLDGATVMLGWPGPEYRSPAHHAEECEQAARWLATPFVVDGVQVEVADVDAHEAQARAAGATIVRELEDLPFGRLYSAADLEGHRWMFMQPA
jgi:PhnB protein